MFKGHDIAFAGVGFLKSPVKGNLLQFLKFNTPLREFVVSKVTVSKHFVDVIPKAAHSP